MTYIVFDTLFTILRVIEIAAIVIIFMSWIMPVSGIRAKLEWLMSPIMTPFRRLNMKLTARMNIPLDFSYMFLLIAIEIARGLLGRLMMYLL